MDNSFSWKDCIEEDYPEDEVCNRVIIKYYLCDEPYYDFFEKCPYGWGTLCKMGAKYLIIPE